MQATRLMLGEYSASLGRAAEAFLDLKLDKTLQTSDWNAPKLTREQIEYAAVDVVVTHRIAEKILPPSASSAPPTSFRWTPRQLW